MSAEFEIVNADDLPVGTTAAEGHPCHRCVFFPCNATPPDCFRYADPEDL